MGFLDAAELCGSRQPASVAAAMDPDPDLCSLANDPSQDADAVYGLLAKWDSATDEEVTRVKDFLWESEEMGYRLRAASVTRAALQLAAQEMQDGRGAGMRLGFRVQPAAAPAMDCILTAVVRPGMVMERAQGIEWRELLDGLAPSRGSAASHDSKGEGAVNPAVARQPAPLDPP